MAIGKKSKFDEHERNSGSIQNESEDSIQKGITSGEKQKINDTGEIKTSGENDIYPGCEYSEECFTHSADMEYLEQPGEKEVKTSSSKTEQDTKKHSISGQNSIEISKVPTIITFTNSTKSDTDLLWDEICNGVKGKNSGIPMGFHRLNKYLGLRKSIYTTIGAAAGCGKTSLVDCAYVLNPYDWYIKNKHKSSVKFEVIYFSMERKKTYKLAKWLCMKIWQEERILMTTDELLSWQTTLDKRKQEVAKFYIDNYFKEMTESGIITIIDGQQNPTGIYKFLHEHALKNGKEQQINQYEKRYTPNDDNLITNVVHDHAGKTKNENIGGKYDKKLTIDKVSEYYCWARDFLGYSPIMINQFNRTSYQDIQYSKKEGGDPDPTVEYWKDSGNVIEDCDVAISLFNPYKYNLEEYMSYNISDFTEPGGANKFRGLKIIKNSYGTDNLRIGLGFLGEISLFKELTKAENITQKELNSVINNDFFLNL